MDELQKKRDSTYDFRIKTTAPDRDLTEKEKKDIEFIQAFQRFKDYDVDKCFKEFSELGIDKVALGFSGGADSITLALKAQNSADRYNIELHLMHVHHGLIATADEWVEHNLNFAQKHGFLIHILYVVIESSKKGIEEAARTARYRAIIDKCRSLNISDVLLAHHIVDQAETILFRLIRGTGILGMQGMPSVSTKEGIRFHRPLLLRRIDRKLLENANIKYIEDPSNNDPKFSRGSIRKHLSEAFSDIFWTWPENVGRFGQYCEDVQDLLVELAKIDALYVNLEFGIHRKKEAASFDLLHWRYISELRQKNLLRYILGELNQYNPNHRKMAEIVRQLQNVHQMGTDREIAIKHESVLITVEEGRVKFYQGNQW